MLDNILDEDIKSKLSIIFCWFSYSMAIMFCQFHCMAFSPPPNSISMYSNEVGNCC